jgi:hypothetical protein
MREYVRLCVLPLQEIARSPKDTMEKVERAMAELGVHAFQHAYVYA